MEIREIPIEDIVLAAYNPRVDLTPDDPEYKRIEASLDEFDVVLPMVWNEFNNVLIAGHQRLKIFKARGYETAPCSVVNIEDQKKEAALNVALNNAFGKWDFPKLKDLVSEIDDGSFDIGITGFGQDELGKMFGYDPGDGTLPDKLDDTDIQGEDTRDSSFIFVYSDESDKEFFMEKFNIDGKKRIYTRKDFEDA